MLTHADVAAPRREPSEVFVAQKSSIDIARDVVARLEQVFCICIRQHTSAYVSILCSCYGRGSNRCFVSAYVSIRQHTSAYVSIRQHTDVVARLEQVLCMCACRHITERMYVRILHTHTSRSYVCAHTHYTHTLHTHTVCGRCLLRLFEASCLHPCRYHTSLKEA
jgi:hypothetical protein